MNYLFSRKGEILLKHDTAEALTWRNSETVCALADSERHLGHVMKIGGRWHAFDATALNETANGFRLAGIFATAALAKQAIEQAQRPGRIYLIDAA